MDRPANGVRTAPRRGSSSTGDIQSVSRVCQILELFSLKPRYNPVEVAQRLGLNRSTTSRYLSSLVREGFLDRAEDGTYMPGPALRGLGVAMVDSSPVAVAGPYMQWLADDVHETVVLSLWGGDGPVISRVEEDSSQLVHVSVRLGSALPYDSAQAQVFLAFMGDRIEVGRLLSRLPDKTRRDLLTQIEHVRRNGYAINSRVVQGVRAVAAPIFGGDGRIEATLAVVGTVNTIPQDRDAPTVQALLETAGRISAERGYSDGPLATPFDRRGEER